jgi:hypothetical protein
VGDAEAQLAVNYDGRWLIQNEKDYLSVGLTRSGRNVAVKSIWRFGCGEKFARQGE